MWLAPLLLFLIGLSWGFSYILIKTGTTGGITPIGYLFWFATGAGMVLLIISAFRRTRFRLTLPYLRYSLMVGACRVAVANTIFYAVQQKIPVGLMAVVMTTAPIFTYGMSLVMRLERYVWLRFAGIICGFAGVLLIVGPRGSLPDPALAFWVALGFAAPLLHSLSNILMSEKNRPQGVESISLAVGMLFAAALMLLPVTIALGQFHVLWPPFSLAERALLLHMVLAGLHFFAIFELIRIAGPTYLSQASFLGTAFGVVFGMTIFHETHSLLAWGAMALIVTGVAMVNARQRQATGK